MKLSEKNCFVFDIDGTISLGNRMIDGARELLEYLKKNNMRYYFLTNNSSKSVDDYLIKLKEMGVAVSRDEIITSSTATINYIKKSYSSDDVFFLIGTINMEQEFREAGIKFITEIKNDINVAGVIVGFDTSLTYQKLKDASHYLRLSKNLIGTNCDLSCPLPNHDVTPDCGSIVELLRKTIECNIVFCGKPNIEIINPILNGGFYKDEVLIVGDRLYTDIALGHNNEIDTALVLTGETKENDKLEISPTFVFSSVKELLQSVKDIK